jgi:tetratricopeptide (TPR) repeat protein
MKRIGRKTLIVMPALLLLNACVTPPTPPGGAPVVDRSVRAVPPAPPPAPVEPPPVQVTPLARPEPIMPEVGPVVPDDRYANPAPTPTAPSPSEPVVAAAPAPTPQVPPPPAELNREGNEAVVALLDSASDYVGAGELDKAAAALERALRIEPRNASIWHDLGQIRLHQGQYQQAESLATKSNSLAGDNNTLKARNWRLIAVSRQAVGDEIGADAAEAQAIVVER